MASLRVAFIYSLLICSPSVIHPLSHNLNEAIQRFIRLYTENASLPINDNFIPEKLKNVIVDAINQCDHKKTTKLPKNVEAKVSFSFVEGLKKNGDQLKSFCEGRADGIFQQLPEHRRHGVVLTPDIKAETEVVRIVLSIPVVWLRVRSTADVYVVRCIRSAGENDSLYVETERISPSVFELHGNFIETELTPAPPNASFVSIALVLDNLWHNYHLPKHFGIANLQMDVEKYYMRNQKTKACNVYLGRTDQPCCLWPHTIRGFQFRECAGRENGVDCEMTRYEPSLIYDANGKAILYKDATRCEIKKETV